MKREIKFRVWDKKKNKMIYPDGKKWGFPLGSSFLGVGTNSILIISPDGDLVKHSKGDNDIRPDCEVVNEDFILMQFTGLLDKNGKEIYEGDVMTDKTRPNRDWVRVWIVWDESQARWALEDNRKDGEFSINYRNWEIIGNIYENPELLKSNMKTEQQLEAEFDKLYSEGEFDDEMLLDDNLLDYRDNWIAEKMNEDISISDVLKQKAENSNE